MIGKLHFSSDAYASGLATVIGFVGYTENGLHIEYQISDSVINAVKSEIKELSIPFENINRLELKTGFFLIN